MKLFLPVFLFGMAASGAWAQSAAIPYDILYGQDVFYDLTQRPVLAAVQTELAQSGWLGNMPVPDLNQNKEQTFFYNNHSAFVKFPVVNHHLNGSVRFFYRSGSLLADIPYQDGRINGVVQTYFPNGNVKMRLTYQNGQREGEAVMYHDNQNVHVTEHYENGQRNGVQKRYDTRGNLRSVLPYTNGVIDGQVLLYDQNGNTVARVTYENGHVTENTCTDLEGNLQRVSPLGLYQIEAGMRPVVCGVQALENLIATTTQ